MPRLATSGSGYLIHPPLSLSHKFSVSLFPRIARPLRTKLVTVPDRSPSEPPAAIASPPPPLRVLGSGWTSRWSDREPVEASGARRARQPASWPRPSPTPMPRPPPPPSAGTGAWSPWSSHCILFPFFFLSPVSWCACATGQWCASSRGLGSELRRTPIRSSSLFCWPVIWLFAWSARSDRCAKSQECHPL